MPDLWPELMGIQRVAQYLDCSVTMAQTILKTHSIPAVQLTPRGDRRYRRKDLDELIDRQFEQPVRSTRSA
jgi:hypothetical protein